MGKTFSHKKLGAEFVLPDPLTAVHWEQYSRDVPEEDATALINVGYIQALRVIESGHCDGVADLKTAGLNVPLAVATWIANKVANAFNDALLVPKE